MNNSLSEKPQDFRQLLDMVFEYFFKEENLIDNNQLIEGINVCVAHLPDLIIDYPNARQYAIEIVTRAVKHEVMQQEQADKYIKHIENIDGWGLIAI